MVLLDGVAGQRLNDNFLDAEKMLHDSEPTPANAPAKAGAGPDAPAPSDLVALTWSEVSSVPNTSLLRRPNTAQQQRQPTTHSPATAMSPPLRGRPVTAQNVRPAPKRAAAPSPSAATRAPTEASASSDAPPPPLPHYMRLTRTSGERQASTAADSAWLSDVFGLPVPSPRPHALADARRPGQLRRACRFVESGEPDQPDGLRPRVLRVTAGGGPVGRAGADASARREWLLQHPMRRRRVLVNMYGGAVSASLAYSAPQGPANWLPPLTSH